MIVSSLPIEQNWIIKLFWLQSRLLFDFVLFYCFNCLFFYLSEYIAVYWHCLILDFEMFLYLCLLQCWYHIWARLHYKLKLRWLSWQPAMCSIHCTGRTWLHRCDQIGSIKSIFFLWFGWYTSIKNEQFFYFWLFYVLYEKLTAECSSYSCWLHASLPKLPIVVIDSPWRPYLQQRQEKWDENKLKDRCS